MCERRTETEIAVKLILSMIVKNEEKIIGRCLDAALRIAKDYVIVDTGSTDGTIKIVREASKRNEAKGVIATDPWKNFGHNRTRAMVLTKEYAEKRNFDLASTYALLLDADMVLHADGFNANDLTSAWYHLEQRDSIGLSWWNTRLCRLDHDWMCVGVTHEYWSPKPGCISANFHGLWIEDVGDGSSHTEKYIRDLALLRQGLSEDPMNGRYMFYIAQSLFDLGRYEEAIAMYERRIEAGKAWESEELWYSRFKIGLAELRLGKEDRGILTLIRAFDERPHRAEPLTAIARHLREHRGRGSTFGLILARRAFEMPVPSGDLLFVDTKAFCENALEEIAILAYYANEQERGRDAAEELLTSWLADDRQSNQALVNVLFYMHPEIKAIRRGKFEVPKELRTFDGIEYLSSSPTIAPMARNAVVNVRLVNYDHQKGRSFVGRHADKKIRTENIICDFDLDSGSCGPFVLQKFEVPNDWTNESRILGLEDERWVRHQDQRFFTAVVYQIPGHVAFPQMALGAEGRFGFSVQPLLYDGAQAVEKSWLPFSYKGDLLLVYGYEPFRILKVDIETARCEPFLELKLPVNARRWRGSVSPTFIGRQLLMLVHEVARRAEDNVYLHRWIELDPETLRPLRFSKLFSFDHHGVEYALGMIEHDGNAIVTYGYEERESRWIEIFPGDIEWHPTPLTET